MRGNQEGMWACEGQSGGYVDVRGAIRRVCGRVREGVSDRRVDEIM